MRRLFAALGILGLLSLGVAPTAVATPGEKVEICHATGSASNPYVTNKVDLNGLEGHGGHGGDIIPPNSYLTAGLNYDTVGEATLKNRCKPVEGPAIPPADKKSTSATPPDPQPTPTRQSASASTGSKDTATTAQTSSHPTPSTQG